MQPGYLVIAIRPLSFVRRTLSYVANRSIIIHTTRMCGGYNPLEGIDCCTLIGMYKITLFARISVFPFVFITLAICIHPFV